MCFSTHPPFYYQSSLILQYRPTNQPRFSLIQIGSAFLNFSLHSSSRDPNCELKRTHIRSESITFDSIFLTCNSSKGNISIWEKIHRAHIKYSP